MARLDGTVLKARSDYLYGVDLVRFACAMAVCLYHFTAGTPEYAWVMPFGWIGVQVFFVISGLVIANSAYGGTARQFVLGRFLRLYPTAWCAAIIGYPLYLLAASSGDHKFLPLPLSMLLLHAPFLASAYWTLPIELSFYFLVFVLLRRRAFRNIQRLAIILILWSAPYLIALFLNTRGLVHWPWIDIGYGAMNMLLVRHGIYFALGMLVWLVKERRINKAGIVAAGFALGLAVLEIYCRGVQLQPDFTCLPLYRPMLWNHLTVSANGAFAAGFTAILLSVRFNRLFPASALLRTAVRTLGLMTYPFYLLHQRVGTFVMDKAGRFGLTRISCVLLAIVCAAGVSLLVAAWWEPALRAFLRRHVAALRPTPKKPVARVS